MQEGDHMTRGTSMAIWALTPDGTAIAATIAAKFPGATIFTGKTIPSPPVGARRFTVLAEAVGREFKHFEAHVFVMAVGIVVRMIAPHIGAKQTDPAVVVVDDTGRFAVSLLSGHSNGANGLAGLIGQFTGAIPVVTTATDNAGVPAIDLLAKKHALFIENPEVVKVISMAFLTGQRVWRHDPWKILDTELKDYTDPKPAMIDDIASASTPGIFIDHTIDHQIRKFSEKVLVARPRTLAVGSGCNSGTSADEIICAVQAVFDQYGLSTSSILHFVTIEMKTREPGLIEAAAYFNRPLIGFSKEELSSVKNVPNPSVMVHKHMGVTSVCEAAAILSIHTEILLVPKQKTKNTTIAVAEKPYTSLASAQVMRHT